MIRSSESTFFLISVISQKDISLKIPNCIYLKISKIRPYLHCNTEVNIVTAHSNNSAVLQGEQLGKGDEHSNTDSNKTSLLPLYGTTSK